MKKIRIGHIGTKHDHSGGKLDCICKYPDLFEIVGIAEEDPVQYEKTFPVVQFSWDAGFGQQEADRLQNKRKG